MPDKKISHDGVVASLSEGRVTVRITSYAACTSCHARGACQIAGGEEDKLLHIPVRHPDFSIGDKVRVILDRSLGFRALLLGYVMPFLLILAILLVMTAAGSPEWIAGLASLSALLPYYMGLKLMRGRVDRQFSFFIQKN
jgi:sigma-E factor negative regulatory protein RseC